MSTALGAGFAASLGVSASAGIAVGATGTATAGNGDSLLRAFRFHVELTDVASGVLFGDGAFQECRRLEIEHDGPECHDGGSNDEVIQRGVVVQKGDGFVGKMQDSDTDRRMVHCGSSPVFVVASY